MERNDGKKYESEVVVWLDLSQIVMLSEGEVSEAPHQAFL